MKAEGKPGAGEARSRGPGPERPSLRQRIELFSLRTPFRVKLGLVWIGIAAVLAGLFALALFDVQWMREHWLYILEGIPFTLLIAILAIILAVILAVIGALARISRNPIAYGVSGFYVSFFRGTPLIVQLFLIYLGLAQIGGNLADRGFFWADGLLTLETLEAGILGLGLNYGAYMTEIFRAGIQSVAHGQAEAAHALGMTYRQTMRRVVLPQAARVIIPPTGNEFIAMLKDSALVGVLGLTLAQADIFRKASLVGRADFRPFEALFLAAMLYWILTSIFTFFQARLERRMSRGHVRGAQFVTTGGKGGAGGGGGHFVG